MAMNKVPTLVVGIGGIGCRMAANVADLLSEEDKEYVGVIGLDTNVNDLRQLKEHGMRTIQTSDDRSVRDYMSEHYFSNYWFPLNRFTAGKSLQNGAGQIRAVSRLAAIAAEEQGKFKPIKEELQRIRKNNGQLTVMVLGSITGGTGAGLFLQLPYYIRKVMHEASGKSDIIIRGMFIGADMTADVQPSEINSKAVHVNGYSCLKELNAVYRWENGMPGKTPLNIDFRTTVSEKEQALKKEQILKKEPDFYDVDNLDDLDEAVKDRDAEILAAGNPSLPYDYLYLIEGGYPEGTVGEAELSNVEELVGRMVYTLMFSPVRENALSVEDNMVLQDMATRGMNRYSSAGIRRLIYPMEVAREYVTLTTVRDMVRDEWLILDNLYKAQVAAARDEQLTNMHAKIPNEAEAYCKNFENIVKDGNSSIARLASEAFVEDGTGKRTSKAVRDFVRWLDTSIKDTAESDKIESSKSKLNINEAQMTEKRVNDTVSNTKQGLYEYETSAKNAINSYSVIANQLFPPAWSIMSGSRKNPNNANNIYSLLYNVHPITARYICYSLIEKLNEIIKEKEKVYNGIDLSQYEETEMTKYKTSKEDKLSLEAALQKVSQIKIPIIASLIKKGQYEKIAKQYINGLTTQKNAIDSYLRSSLYIKTCKLLVSRLEMLSNNYKIFFESIAEKIRFNDVRIKHLEGMKLPLGQIGVYCSKEALECISKEFQNNNDGEMQQATKTAIFEQLYHIFDKEYADRGKVLTEKQKEKKIQLKLGKLATIFEKAVIDTVRTSVVENGAGVIDITVREALEKEYDLVMPENVSCERYIQDRVEEAMRGAAPMLAVETNAKADNTETVYLALNPRCGDAQISIDGSTAKVSAAATEASLIPHISDATDNLKPTVILNESFSPYEITCFKARYKFAIEDLTRYKDDSRSKECYDERISKIGTIPLDTGNPDDGLTVVPPHLDRYWHEEAYLPPITEISRVNSERELYQAFIYAMGTDVFKSIKRDALLDPNTGEELLGWYYMRSIDGMAAPLKVKGTPVGTSYAELFRALPHLGKYKKMIMIKEANESLDEGKKAPSVEEREADILNNPFIADLVQKTKDIDESDKVTDRAEGNILDIFYEMRSSLTPDEWSQLFDALLFVLQKYCKDLYGYNNAKQSTLPIVNRSVRKILEEMKANSRIAGKTTGDQDISSAEKALIERYDHIHDHGALKS